MRDTKTKLNTLISIMQEKETVVKNVTRTGPVRVNSLDYRRRQERIMRRIIR